MRFRKNVPAEHREFLQEQLKQYKKEITMSKDELRELEKWVASGRSPYDNGDYIYSENGCPEEEREQELRELRGDYDTVSDSIIINTEWSDPVMDPDAELPFS